MVYNPKLRDGKPQLRSQMVITQGTKELFREPSNTIESNGSALVTKMGPIGPVKSRARTLRADALILTDTLADKKNQTISPQIDFTVVELIAV